MLKHPCETHVYKYERQLAQKKREKLEIHF